MNQSSPEPRDLFAIADLAREFGISNRAIRFYESKGLLSPERVGGARIFRRRDRARLILILRGKRLGFSLRDISDYLSLYDAQSRTAQVALLVVKVEERLSLLEAQKHDLDTTIAELHEIRQLASERSVQEVAAGVRTGRGQQN
jgi:DNA-binding transcriptional MerR regulator